MVTLAFLVADLHFVGSPEVVSGSHVDVLAKQQICPDGQMFDEALVPVVQSRKGGRHPQR